MKISRTDIIPARYTYAYVLSADNGYDNRYFFDELFEKNKTFCKNKTHLPLVTWLLKTLWIPRTNGQ